MKKIFFLLSMSCFYAANAQIVQSDIDLLDYQRLAQISDSTNTDARSFTNRSSSLFWQHQLKAAGKINKPYFQFLQASYQQQYNSKLATSANDGSLLPALGLQHRLSVGAFFRYKNLTIQLQPEFVQAANEEPKPFNGNPFDGNYFPRYYMYQLNKLDNLSQFGTAPITRVLPGQSSITYNTGGISVGISTENLWWGPARKNSLVLTNNAAGFLHGTVQSIEPLKTPLGNIEFQLIYGSLQNTPFEPEDHKIMRTIWTGGMANKSSQTRNIFGYNFSFQPKGMENFYIGFTGTSYFYGADTNTQSNDIVRSYENKPAAARMGAIYARYKMPNEQAEIYAEYGRSNRWAAPWNLFGDTIPTGYTIGMRKMFGRIMMNFELTQLQLPDARLIFDSSSTNSTPKTNSWYNHPYITQGYSNWGEVMGASIGPGSNSVHLELAWIKGLKKIGFTAERIANNNDFAIYNYFSGIVGAGLADRYWVNQQIALNAQWDFGNFLFSGSVQSTKALNYRWVNLSGEYSQGSPDSDRKSVRAQISLIYFFKKPNFTP